MIQSWYGKITIHLILNVETGSDNVTTQIVFPVAIKDKYRIKEKNFT